MKKILTALITLFVIAVSMGCAATSLQCGVDGVSSYINLTTSSDIQVRTLTELCSFNSIRGP